MNKKRYTELDYNLMLKNRTYTKMKNILDDYSIYRTYDYKKATKEFGNVRGFKTTNTICEEIKKRFLKISYGITVHNEAEELQKLLEVLNKNIDKEDEIVVCVDGDDEKVEAVLGEFLSEHKAIVYKRKLEKDFSAQKTLL